MNSQLDTLETVHVSHGMGQYIYCISGKPPTERGLCTFGTQIAYPINENSSRCCFCYWFSPVSGGSVQVLPGFKFRDKKSDCIVKRPEKNIYQNYSGYSFGETSKDKDVAIATCTSV